jgi:glycine cleavage system H protein
LAGDEVGAKHPRSASHVADTSPVQTDSLNEEDNTMQIGKYQFPDDLYYDKAHNWARVEGEVVTQGLSDFAQAIAGEILYAEVPRKGRDLQQGKPFMSLESGKWVGRVEATVSGKVVDANADLEWESDQINKDPYGKGWLVRIEATNLEPDLNNLMRPSSPQFAAFMQEEMKKYGK